MRDILEDNRFLGNREGMLLMGNLKDISLLENNQDMEFVDTL